MPLGREVGLGQSDIVSDGDPAPLPKKGADPPIFSPCLLWPNGWMNQDTSWYGGRRQPMPHCVRLGPRPPLKGAQLSASFRPMSIVAKVAHLSYC